MQMVCRLHWDVLCCDDKESQGLVVGESGREGEVGDRERDGHKERWVMVFLFKKCRLQLQKPQLDLK